MVDRPHTWIAERETDGAAGNVLAWQIDLQICGKQTTCDPTVLATAGPPPEGNVQFRQFHTVRSELQRLMALTDNFLCMAT